MGSSPSDTRWLALILSVSEGRKDGFAALLLQRGAQGLSEDHPGLHFEDGNELYVTDDWTVPEPANPTGRVELRAWFRDEDDPSALLEEATSWAAMLGEESFESRVEPVEDRDWNAAWKEQWDCTLLSPRLMVVPDWLEVPELEPGQRALRLDPGLAFGTGTHETTALCAEFVEETLATRPGCRVLDVGTGTGILAVAALLLGADEAVGVDTDPAAVEVARETAQKNGVLQRFVTQRGSADAVEGSWDLVLGNLLAPLIVRLAEPLAARTAPDGSLVVSGLLTHQAEGVIDSLGNQDMKLAERRDRGEWSALRFVHGGRP